MEKKFIYRLQREFTDFEWTLEGHNSKHGIYHLLQIWNAAYLCSDHQVQGVFIFKNLTFQFYGLLILTDVWSRKSNCGQYLHSSSLEEVDSYEHKSKAIPEMYTSGT